MELTLSSTVAKHNKKKSKLNENYKVDNVGSLRGPLTKNGPPDFGLKK